MSAGHTPAPWYVGAQNDLLYVVAGRAPAVNNDYPWHDAPRVAVAKVFYPAEGDCPPINAQANARLIAAAPELLEALGKLCAAAPVLEAYHHAMRDCECAYCRARAAIAKATGAA